SDSPVWTWFLGYNLDVDRQLAYQLPTQYESIHKYVVQLPDAYRLENWPENLVVKSPWGFFKLNVTPDKDDPRRFEAHMHFRLEKTRVEKSEFAAFVHFQDEVKDVYRVYVNMRPTTDIADAPKLEKLLAKKESSDAMSLRILAKLYLDYDRAADARRVLEKASLLFPNDKGLWELRVQASANVEAEEQLYRAMVKQFPSDPKYAIALGAACVRREDHEEAKKILTPLAKHALAPVRAAAQYQLARSEYRQKNAAAALKHLQAALVAD